MLRTFKRGWYHLLEDYDAPPSTLASTVEDLETQHGRQLANEAKAERRTETPPVMLFEDQVRVFRHMYPQGFEDPKWIDQFRSPTSGARRKRHLDPAVREARELLPRDLFQGELAAEQATEVMARAVEVLDGTKLASPSHVVRPLRELDPAAHLPVVRALGELLYGEGTPKERFRGWLVALEEGGLSVSWPMVTVLPALVHPEEHVAVRRSAMRDQARGVLPDKTLRKTPSPGGYATARLIAETVRDKLRESGLSPRDLLDVRQFVWETLRPKGQQVLAKMRRGEA